MLKINECLNLFLYFNCILSIEINDALFLTPLIESEKLDEARQLSRVRFSEFGCKTESYSGYLTVDKQFNSNLYFWFFKSKNPNAPVVLWLQGGPGSNSMFGLFLENGPFKVNKKRKVKCRKYSWTRAFSMLYIDSPVGSGFSFTENENGYATNLKNVTDNLLKALMQFFTLFKELKFKDFYLSGESYAGKYLPALANQIHTSNEKFSNLKGIAVGNGLIDPVSSLSYGSYLYQYGLIDEKQKKIFEGKEKEIQTLIERQEFEVAYFKWDKLIKGSFTGASILESFTGYKNNLDQRFINNPFENSTYYIQFLNQPLVKRALHVGNISFVGQFNNIPVIKRMIGDILRSEKETLASIMNDYKVLLYGGNMDIILPPVIAYHFVQSLKWKFHDQYFNATRKIWKVSQNDHEVAGYVKKVCKYREVVIRNSGHIVPYDQPRAAFDMITKFVNDAL